MYSSRRQLASKEVREPASPLAVSHAAPGEVLGHDSLWKQVPELDVARELLGASSDDSLHSAKDAERLGKGSRCQPFSLSPLKVQA